MQEPETSLVLEAPAGIVKARLRCRAGRVEQVRITNVPSFVDRLDAPLEVAGIGTLKVDVAYGGDSFVIVDGKTLGLAIQPDEAHAIAELGMKITRAANEQLPFQHPENPGWSHISFCQVTGPTAREDGVLCGSSAVAIRP